MTKNIKNNRSTWVNRLTLFGVFLLLAGFICISYSIKSSSSYDQPSITQAKNYLDRSLSELGEQGEYLRYESYQLSDEISRELSNNPHDRLAVFRSMNQYRADLRHAILYKNGTPWTWTGTILSSSNKTLKQPSDLGSYTYIDPIQKGLVFRSQIETPNQDSTTYHLVTQQLLPDQFQLVTTLFDQPSNKIRPSHSSFPIRLAINYVPPRDSLLLSSPLSLQGQDSVGVAYIPPSSLAQNAPFIASTWQWINLIFICSGLLLLFIAGWIWSTLYSDWITLGFRITLWLITGILVFVYVGQSASVYWLPSIETSLANIQLIQYSLFSLFAAALSTTVISILYKQRRLYGFTWYPRTIIASLLFGIVSALLLLYSSYYTLDTVEQLGYRVLNLSILPDAKNFILQISSGFLWGAILSLITTLSWFLFNSEQDQLRWVPPFTIAGFLSTLLIYFLISTDSYYEVLLITIMALIAMSLCVYIGYSLHSHSMQWRFISRARFYALAIFFVALGTYFLFNYGVNTQLRNALSTSAEQAAVLPIGAEQDVAGVISESLQKELQNERVAYGATAYPLEAQLRHELDQQTQQLEDRYVIQAYILDQNDQLVASASTGLSSQTLSELLTIISSNGSQSIGGSKSGNRHYGWSQQSLGSRKLVLYVETRHSEREQPLFIPDESNPNLVSGQSPVQMLIYYQEGNLASIESRGNTHTFPIQQQLAAQYDEAVWEEYSTDHGTFLSYIYPMASVDQTIMVISQIPNWQQHLYLLFRYYFVLLIGGLLLLQILSWLGILEASIYRKNERFRNRIIDSYLIASLTFLVILTVATHVIMQQQHRSQVEQRLMETLDQLSETLPDEVNQLTDQQLLRYSTPFQVDALLYQQAELSHSTYPEMVTQGWFTAILPYDIYHQLFTLQQKRAVHLQTLPEQSNLSLLYSYQRLNQNSDWVVAVPTFLDQSRIDQQLLQTITYLLVIYVFIFGLFMFSAAIIARELTRPLVYFQSGLKRISSGKLDTTIPVTTQDEIGSLAHAYNVMVYKLKDLRKELAEAERQAAWTEMARQVAHEIKNPLTPMKLKLQHLQRMITSGKYDIDELKPKADEITSSLVEQIQSLSAIASDFSRFAKPFETELREIDLNNLLHDIDQLYEHDERIHIEPDLANTELPIMAATDELKRVFINLVKNASEAMPHGGVILLRSYEHKEHAYVDVVDNGFGISDDHKSKIFVPNFSTKTSGTGLGLAISKKIIEAHQGEIDFASVPGSGTTFTIALPLKNGHSTQQ